MLRHTDGGDDSEAVEERSRKWPGAGDVSFSRRSVASAASWIRLRSQRLVVVVVILAVVALHDELDDLLLEQLHLDGDGLVPLARVEDVQFVRYVPQIADRGFADPDHILVAPLLVLRLDGHKGERSHDDVAYDQATNAHVTEQEGDEFTGELFHFVDTRVGIGGRRMLGQHLPPHRPVVPSVVMMVIPVSHRRAPPFRHGSKPTGPFVSNHSATASISVRQPTAESNSSLSLYFSSSGYSSAQPRTPDVYTDKAQNDRVIKTRSSPSPRFFFARSPAFMICWRNGTAAI